MQCPVCRVLLERSQRAGINIDTCPRCRGVWLDRGELDQIIRRAGTEDAGVAPPVYTPPPTPGRLAGADIPGTSAFPPSPAGPHDAGEVQRRGTIWREVLDF